MRVICTVFCLLSIAMTSFSQQTAKQKSTATKSDGKKALRFVVFGDWGRNGEDKQRETAREMGIDANKFKPAFIVSTGDNIYPSGVRSTRDYNWLASFEEIYTAHSLQTDWYVVLGNHDYKGSTQAEIDYSAIDRRWNMPATYYAKTFFIGGDSSQGILMVFIDTTPLISEYYVGTEHHVIAADTATQRIWLEKTLREAPPSIKWKFVFGHHPLWTGGNRMKAPEVTELKSLLRPIFEKYHVNAYICGHDHNLQYIKPEGFTHYFVSGAGSETTPVVLHPDGGKFAKSINGFMDFSVFSDQLELNVISYLGESLYRVTIPRQ